MYFLEAKLAAKDVPNDLVADIHSCIGLMQEKLGNISRAIRSLMNALWIQQKQSSLTDANQVAVALTEHRLGRLYAQTGDFDNAVALMEKAYNSYQQSKMKSDHAVFLQAEESLRAFQMKKLEKDLSERSAAFYSGVISSVQEEGGSGTSSTSTRSFAAVQA
jgi:tetratricopeptide (TPR) repeat protein